MCKRRLLGLIVPVYRYTNHKLRCIATPDKQGGWPSKCAWETQATGQLVSHQKFFPMELPSSDDDDMKNRPYPEYICGSLRHVLTPSILGLWSPNCCPTLPFFLTILYVERSFFSSDPRILKAGCQWRTQSQSELILRTQSEKNSFKTKELEIWSYIALKELF